MILLRSEFLLIAACRTVLCEDQLFINSGEVIMFKRQQFDMCLLQVAVDCLLACLNSKPAHDFCDKFSENSH